MAANPWMTQALVREEAAGNDVMEKAAIREEYAWRQYPARPCSCGSQRHIKVSVGAFKCPDCGALETFRGEVL